MKEGPHTHLSRRERQIMDLIYAHDSLSAADVHERLPDAPSYSAVRALLRILVDKGHLRYRQVGPRYIYRPTLSRERAKRSALSHLLRTFFEGSTEQAVATLLDMSSADLTEEELDRLARMIDQARSEGR